MIWGFSNRVAIEENRKSVTNWLQLDRNAAASVTDKRQKRLTGTDAVMDLQQLTKTENVVVTPCTLVLPFFLPLLKRKTLLSLFVDRRLHDSLLPLATRNNAHCHGNDLTTTRSKRLHQLVAVARNPHNSKVVRHPQLSKLSSAVISKYLTLQSVFLELAFGCSTF